MNTVPLEFALNGAFWVSPCEALAMEIYSADPYGTHTDVLLSQLATACLQLGPPPWGSTFDSNLFSMAGTEPEKPLELIGDALAGAGLVVAFRMEHTREPELVQEGSAVVFNDYLTARNNGSDVLRLAQLPVSPVFQELFVAWAAQKINFLRPSETPAAQPRIVARPTVQQRRPSGKSKKRTSSG